MWLEPRTDEVTIVTALFDLGRGDADHGLSDDQRRPFDTYLTAFRQVLALDAPMCVYVPPELESLVHRLRDSTRTRVLVHDRDSLLTRFPFHDAIQTIRSDPAWRSRAHWLAGSPQANLPLYNPLVMSKLPMLNDQQLLNPFGTERFLWLDAGLARTCGAFLARPDWLNRIGSVLERFLLICFPYTDGTEIHGFEREAMAGLAGTDRIRRVARGGLFGGCRDAIAQANALYYRLLELSFAQGEMGTEESILTIMSYLQPEHIDRFDIAGDGLLGPFFEALRAGPIRLTRTDVIDAHPEPARRRLASPRPSSALSTATYILTYNQPGQLALLIERWRQQPGFVEQTNVTVIDNSTDSKALLANRQLCKELEFGYVARGNLGICGGRQLAAELFDESTHDYMVFLEDDMLLVRPGTLPCQAGLQRWVENLHDRSLRIMEQERFDFLKLSYSEFYGNNAEQWAWHNVPAALRQRFWPDHPATTTLTGRTILPPVRIERIGIIAGLAYACGEIYYANWPQLVSREGNRRMFLETRWAKPYEQTWMSHLFQKTRAGELKPAVLLASPIEHDRKFHYPRSERVES